MKNLLVLVCLLLPVCCSARAGKTVKLTVMIADCRDTTGGYEAYFDTLFVYGFNGNLAGKYAEDDTAWPKQVVINDLSPGRYKLRYMNLHQQWMEKYYTLADSTDNIITLCIDSAKSYKHNTLSKLKGNDRLVVAYTSLSCGGYRRDRLIVRKKGSQFIATIYTLILDFDHRRPLEDIPVLGRRLLGEIVLTDKQIEGFTRFENELRLNHDGGCTTSDSYKVTSKYFNGHFIDDSCEWYGFAIIEGYFPDFEKKLWPSAD